MKQIILGIVAAVFLFLVGYYMPSKSKKLLAYYDGVFGWFSALILFWMGVPCFLAPIFLIGELASLFSGEGPVVEVLASIVAAIFVFAVSCFLYRNAKKKCPGFMQRKLLSSMLIAGGGIMFHWAMTIIWKMLLHSTTPFGGNIETVRVSEGEYFRRLNGEYGELRVTSVHPTGKEGQMIDTAGSYHSFRVDSRGDVILDNGETLEK